MGTFPIRLCELLFMSSLPPRATLIEVATLAGTSKTSVSRFFGPERDRLSPKLRERIEQAAHTLGYRPNLMARGLKGGGSRLLGMLVADIRNPFSVAVVHGVEQAARAYGYSLIVCNTDNDPEQEQHHLELLAAYQVEGIIINAAGQPESQLTAIKRAGVPVVLLDRDIHTLSEPVIGLDNALAIDMALNHLIGQGYRTVLYVSNPPEGASARQERLVRFQHQASQRGLNAHTLTELNERALSAALTSLASAVSSTPSAVLCANGTATLSVVQSFQAQGLTMGPLGLMGIDEMAWCDLVGPGITTLAQPTDAIGHTAVKHLLHPTDTAITFRHPPRLHARGSTVPGKTRTTAD